MGGGVRVLALGGTIAMTGSGGVAPTLTGDDLLAAVPGLAEFGIVVEQVRQLPGASLGVLDLLEVLERVDAACASGVDGVVVVQGTDTIEETAFVLDVLHRHRAPVVVTGAMRNPMLPGADGPANLSAAVRVAASRQARGVGCVVVLNDQVHAGRWVVKTHTASPAAFTSPGVGPVGWVAEDRVHLPLAPTGRHTIARPAGPVPPVGLYTVTLGDSPELLAGLAGGCAGLVVAGMGVGHVPAGLVETLTDVAARMPVVLASRAGAGSVHTATYAFAGSESDLLGRGLIAAGSLHPLKARLLLRLLLAAGTEPAALRAMFGRVSG